MKKQNFFATRFRGSLQLKKSVVYTVKVPIEDVVAYIERENEVVCIPVSRGGKMEVIKEESMLWQSNIWAKNLDIILEIWYNIIVEINKNINSQKSSRSGEIGFME